ncbi:MAG: DUF3306 domain-containing protein [Geminicoccaceae bacterium]|nr:DUF3306 domain-containing protein [Geminicoccaceae bacterium]MDW8369117.1 DUF3306 domain-containing protein [Geminicoccaceae bacterium]
MRRPIEDEVGSFLARWSRRKAAARRGAPEPEPAAAAPLRPSANEEVAPERAAARAAEPAASVEESLPELDLAQLPDPDTLDAASDFSVFMRPGVPAELRRRALRRLWRVNPIIATPDGIDDYYIVNDFSDASTVVADLKTLYRVGRGMVTALGEEAEEAEKAVEAAVEDTARAASGASAQPAAAIAATRGEQSEPPLDPSPGGPGGREATLLPRSRVGSNLNQMQSSARGGGDDRAGREAHGAGERPGERDDRG